MSLNHPHCTLIIFINQKRVKCTIAGVLRDTVFLEENFHFPTEHSPEHISFARDAKIDRPYYIQREIIYNICCEYFGPSRHVNPTFSLKVTIGFLYENVRTKNREHYGKTIYSPTRCNCEHRTIGPWLRFSVLERRFLRI